MKPSALILALMLPCLGNCRKNDRPSAVPRTDLQLSSHPRAAVAAKKVRPALERDLSSAGLRLGDPIFIRAFKQEKIVELHVENIATGKFELFRTYPIAAASGVIGPKLKEGDGQVPEGFYSVPLSRMNPESKFHLSFNIGFPNAYDTSHQRTGSLIMIHGSNVSIGCLAMTDSKIEEIYTLTDAALRNGQPLVPVHLFPFRMTDEQLSQAAGNPNAEFWKALKQGHDLFETNRVPPEINVENGRYVFK